MPLSSEDVRPHEYAVCNICLDLSEIETPSTKLCLQCKHYFCDAHTSSVDLDYCDNCLRPSGVATTSEKIVDDDGVSHQGRSLKLTGEFWASMQQDVRDMSDSELEAHVVSLQQAVREIEFIRDYRKIALGHGENELEVRKSGKLRRLRLIKDVNTGRISVGSVKERRKSRPKDAVQSVIEMLKGLNMTPAQIASILANAKGAKP
jgi:hypothetical protein